MLRVEVSGAPGLADAAARVFRKHGLGVVHDGSQPVALVVVVDTPDVRSRGATAAGARLVAATTAEAAGAAAVLYRDRLAPWDRALESGRPDVVESPRLLPHDPGWVEVADERSGSLRRPLAELDPGDRLGLRRIDHVGSTAVPGLAAKPYLDLQVTLDTLPALAALAPVLAPPGWAPAVGARPDSPGVHRDVRHAQDTAPDGVFRKHLFVAPDPVRPAILHVRRTRSPFARRVVRFRDRLQSDPHLRRAYEDVKRRAAAAHAGDDDYDDYTRDKGAWLADVYAGLRGGPTGTDDPWPLDG